MLKPHPIAPVFQLHPVATVLEDPVRRTFYPCILAQDHSDMIRPWAYPRVHRFADIALQFAMRDLHRILAEYSEANKEKTFNLLRAMGYHDQSLQNKSVPAREQPPQPKPQPPQPKPQLPQPKPHPQPQSKR
jgi:hypothetical protein